MGLLAAEPTSEIMKIDYQELQQIITDMDQSYISEYNAKKPSHYRIHEELGPCPFEGDIEKVVVLILLANPMFSPASRLTDHTLGNHHAGWGIFSLEPSSNDGIRAWWTQHLGPLQRRTQFSWRELSNKVAAVQVHTWASERFDESFKPPSLILSKQIAKEFATRAQLIVCARRRAYWQETLCHSSDAKKMIYLKSVRRPYISAGNVPDVGFERICSALMG